MYKGKRIKRQYFIVKNDTIIYNIIKEYFKEKRILKEDIREYAEDMKLKTRDIFISQLGVLYFIPTQKDMNKYKGKLMEVGKTREGMSTLYSFSTTSKEYKEFKKRVKDGKFAIPYLELSKELGIPSIDEWRVTMGDITGEIHRLTNKRYLLSLTYTPQVVHSDLIELTEAEYEELKKERIEEL